MLGRASLSISQRAAHCMPCCALRVPVASCFGGHGLSLPMPPSHPVATFCPASHLNGMDCWGDDDVRFTCQLCHSRHNAPLAMPGYTCTPDGCLGMEHWTTRHATLTFSICCLAVCPVHHDEVPGSWNMAAVGWASLHQLATLMSLGKAGCHGESVRIHQQRLCQKGHQE